MAIHNVCMWQWSNGKFMAQNSMKFFFWSLTSQGLCQVFESCWWWWHRTEQAYAKKTPIPPTNWWYVFLCTALKLRPIEIYCATEKVAFKSVAFKREVHSQSCGCDKFLKKHIQLRQGKEYRTYKTKSWKKSTKFSTSFEH